MTEEELTEARQNLAEREYESLSEGDIINILLEGCVGWNNMTEETIQKGIAQ